MVPDEAERVHLTNDALIHFYTVDLPNAVDGKHPSLVFNMDEMGAERFADRKAVFTFLPPQVDAERDATLGVRRTSNRCTLVACIALDGTTLMPTVITKTRMVNTNVFEKGYGPENVALFSTKNSFIRGDVFGDWLREVFVPYVVETRARLHREIGRFDDTAVLVLDGCSAHRLDDHTELLRANGIETAFLPPHSSHMTQPLDVGIFGLVKRLLRSEASYKLDADGVDAAVPEDMAIDLNAADVPQRRAEWGLAQSEYVLDILDAFERSTTRRLVVSAFVQAGILYRIPEAGDLRRRVAYVDPAFARVVNRKRGLFEGLPPASYGSSPASEG